MSKCWNFGVRLSVGLIYVLASTSLASAQSTTVARTALPGESKTLLPDGRWLITGGAGSSSAQNSTAIGAAADSAILLPTVLQRARAWHTATVLPQGMVLILGGVDAAGLVETPELFDPSILQFQALPTNPPSPRAYHTATLLTDGSLLIAGGVTKDGRTSADAELWDPQTGISKNLPSKLSVARRNHTATLLPDGKVLLWGGLDQNGSVLQNGEIYDPDSQSFTAVNAPPGQSNVADLRVAASLPADGAVDVSVGSFIALRFSEALRVSTVNPTTVTLGDSQSTITAKVVPAEGGMLAFVLPQAPLSPGTTYTLSVDGPSDASNRPLARDTITFTTAGESAANSSGDAAKKQAALDSTVEPDNTPPLQGPVGVTGLAGRVLLSNNAKPLQGVSLELTCGTTKKAVQSDGTGRFLIAGISSGHCKLEIDGTATAQQNKTYGVYFAGVDIKAGQTNVLPYFIWLTEIDTAHAVTIPSPTTSETVVSTPLLQGLELHIPANTVITDYDGNPVTQVSITQIPLGRPPFPLPNVPVDFYFTIQPGGGYVKVNGSGPQGARLIYPNAVHAPAGAVFDFWNYDPNQKGWYVYGEGTVSADRRSIVPDPGVVLYSFTGAMSTGKGCCPPHNPNPNCGEVGCPGGEPVDLGTGLFTMEKTDLSLPGVMPIALTRTYRQGDNMSRAFGVGTTHPYNLFLANAPDSNYTSIDLILPDGGRIQYKRTTSATGCDANAIWEHTGTQTKFYKSRLSFSTPLNSFLLTFKDGAVWIFPEGFQKNAIQSAITTMSDRNGNSLTMARDLNTGNLNRITSSSGRWISLTYDAAGRITQAQDNSGRTVGYSYDNGGRLIKVTDANGGLTQYAYDPNNQLMTITDPRNITYLTNYYDGNGRVVEQDMADGGVYHFAYTLDQNGNIIQTDVTNPRGFIDRSVFDTSGYFSGGNLTSYIRAFGQPEQQTTTYQYDPAGTGLMLSSTDPLGRQTTFAYDSSGCGNMTGITRLAGTSNAVTTTMAYQTPAAGAACVTVFNQVTSITSPSPPDPLAHTTTFGYDGTGKNLTSITDPLQHGVTIVPNSDGQPASIADFAGTTSFGYGSSSQTSCLGQGLTGDLVTVTTDPTGLKITTCRTLDLAGRLVRLQAPLGQLTQYQYDALNDLLKIIDPLNGQTNFTYDGNGNLLTVQDANTHTTTYTPNSMDRVASRKDALMNPETYQYDPNGNLLVFLDRKNQQTSICNNSTCRDGLDRLKHVAYNDGSTIDYTYDAGNRLTTIVDSISGTITRVFDGLDRLASETTSQGSVSYTYDNANRRSTMTVAGQSTVNYTYDNANRLTQITQGTATVTIGYDNANRRTSLTLPNGIVAAYGYDAASRVNSVTYTQGQTTIGNLTYTYDANGRRTSMGGSLAHVNLPTAITSATYNANNQLTNWNGTTLTYDLNGNLTNDGATAYTWDARNHLAAFGSTNFAYDSSGRRTRNATGTAFLYDGANPVQELSGGSVTANLLTGLGVDEIFTRTDSAGVRNFLDDALGSTVALTDSAGTTQTQYTYEPFGKTTASGQANTSTFEYTGRENDGTGLYYYRARYYNPTLARFISEDPLGFGGGQINLYGYASNRPADRVDPGGTSSWGIHWEETYTAAINAGFSSEYASVLANEVVGVDNLPGSQGTDSSSTHMHGMGGRKSNGNKERCGEAYQGAIDALAQDIAGAENRNQGDLAKALHLIEDSYAAGHQYQFWCGFIQGCYGPSHVSGDQVQIPAAIAASAQLLLDLKNGVAINAKDYLFNPDSNCK